MDEETLRYSNTGGNSTWPVMKNESLLKEMKIAIWFICKENIHVNWTASI